MTIDIYLKKPYYHGRPIVKINAVGGLTAGEVKRRVSNKTGLPMKGITLAHFMGPYNEEYLIDDGSHVFFTFNTEHMPMDQKINVFLMNQYGNENRGFLYTFKNERRNLSVKDIYDVIFEDYEEPHNLFIFHHGKLLDRNNMKRITKIDAGPTIDLSIIMFN